MVLKVQMHELILNNQTAEKYWLLLQEGTKVQELVEHSSILSFKTTEVASHPTQQ